MRLSLRAFVQRIWQTKSRALFSRTVGTLQFNAAGVLPCLPRLDRGRGRDVATYRPQGADRELISRGLHRVAPVGGGGVGICWIKARSWAQGCEPADPLGRISAKVASWPPGSAANEAPLP